MCLNAYKHKDTGGTIWGKETVDKLKFLEKKIELMVHCEGIVQSRMNDPKSFEVIDGRWFFKRDNQCAKAREANANETCTEWTATYRFKFSGKNAFGGRVQQAAKFVFDANTSELIDAEIE